MNRERLEKIKAAYGQPMKDGNYPDEMIAEIEKCWAITELAVKRMQYLSTHVGDILANDFYFEAYAELKKKAFEYASEIERLSHA